jgi:hypothetical protein
MRGKLDPGREPPLHVGASAKRDLARANRPVRRHRPVESLLWLGCVGFCIVADRAVTERLLHRPPAHQEGKPRGDAGPLMTRLSLRGTRSELLATNARFSHKGQAGPTSRRREQARRCTYAAL